MDFNTPLIRLGIDTSCFVNEANEPIKTKDGFIYEVEQRKDQRECPYCHSDRNVVVNDYDYIEINCSDNDYIRDIVRIKKVRFKCRDCNKTFTPEIRGIERYSKVSDQTMNMIVSDFTKMITFNDIGRRYNLTKARVLQIFDEKITFVPRGHMPEVLCIDEIKFNEEINQKYCCVLYDYNQRKIVDIIKNRQIAYLDEYFINIPEKERNNVRFFISDMYDGYASVRKRYFKNAIHIIDLFHVISQMTNAIGRIRIQTMKSLSHDSLEYKFMKSYWKYFLCRKENIPDRFFSSRKMGKIFHFDDMVFSCITKNQDFLEAYNILQDLYHYNQLLTFNESLDFIDFITNRLLSSKNDILSSVGYTYKRWSIEIACGLARNQHGKHYTNGIAESINNQLKTIIKVSYGYHNFDRFRKRALLIISYKKI